MYRITLLVISIFIISCSSGSDDANAKTPMEAARQGLEINKALISDTKKEISITILSHCMTVGFNSGTTATEIIDTTSSKMDPETQKKLIMGMTQVKTQGCVRNLVNYFTELSKIEDDRELFDKLNSIASPGNNEAQKS